MTQHISNMSRPLVDRAPILLTIVTSLGIAIWATCPLTSSYAPNALTHVFKLATIPLFALTCEYAARRISTFKAWSRWALAGLTVTV